MTNEIRGACHCGNVSYVLTTSVPLTGIRARACDCSFCRIHAAHTWSDPAGSATIEIRDATHVNRYRFASRSADFIVCRVCGAYLGALLTDGDRAWSTINLRLSSLEVDAQATSYGLENAAERSARRRRVWTPTVVVTRA